VGTINKVGLSGKIQPGDRGFKAEREKRNYNKGERQDINDKLDRERD